MAVKGFMYIFFFSRVVFVCIFKKLPSLFPQPEMTMCGWQDVKIQALTSFFPQPEMSLCGWRDINI